MPLGTMASSDGGRIKALVVTDAVEDGCECGEAAPRSLGPWWVDVGQGISSRDYGLVMLVNLASLEFKLSYFKSCVCLYVSLCMCMMMLVDVRRG